MYCVPQQLPFEKAGSHFKKAELTAISAQH